MKYRILTDGKDYILQIKTFLFWHTLKYCPLGGHFPTFFPKRFKTEKEVEILVKHNWGTIAERVRKYKTI